jgi:hypothetical protein
MCNRVGSVNTQCASSTTQYQVTFRSQDMLASVSTLAATMLHTIVSTAQLIDEPSGLDRGVTMRDMVFE